MSASGRNDVLRNEPDIRCGWFRTHTGECTVTACRTESEKSLETKVRKGGDFFYGKSSNENYPEGL